MGLQNSDIQDLFQKSLGRQATQPELDFLSSQGASLDPMTLGSILQGHPEALNTTLQGQGQALSGLLGQSDQNILEKAGQAINGQFAEQGRGSGSSGMGNSLLQVGQNLAQNRQGMLADFYGRGYSGIQNQQAGLGNSGLSQFYGNQNAARDFNYGQQMYGRYLGDYNNQLNQQRGFQRQGAFGALGGSALGAGLGGYFGGGAGALAGAKLGGSLGSFGQFF